MLLVPQLEQTCRGGRLDSTDPAQIVDIGGSQPLAVDLIGADEEIAPPMKLRAKIVGQTEIRQAFIDQALSNPSADIAENLLGLGDGRGYSELGKRGSQPAATAQKQFCRISVGRWR